jgi:hypothetical protein
VSLRSIFVRLEGLVFLVLQELSAGGKLSDFGADGLVECGCGIELPAFF